MNEQEKGCNCEMHEALMAEFADADRLKVEEGHPIDIMQRENSAFIDLIYEILEALAADDINKVIAGLKKLMAIHSHYGKKEELFMPILYQHGVTGPSQVMWTADDEIKLEVRKLNQKISVDNYFELKERVADVVYRIKDMISREEVIFLPLSNKFFTQDEWLMIYRDIPEFGYALIEDVPKQSEGEEWIKSEAAKVSSKVDEQSFIDGVIHFPTGDVTFAQLEGILKLLPVDITFIDVEGNVKFFVNEGGTFSRPLSALGRSVLLCHPPKVIPVIEKLFEDFKTKKRRSMEVWKQVKGKPVAVKYLAVYDKSDEYIGTVELVEDFTEALNHFGNK